MMWLENLQFSLASDVKDGCIVELGAFHGRGTITLARGARAGYGARVYTVDDYVTKRGWIGEPYGPDDKQIFKDRIRMAKVEVTLINKDFHEASLNWLEPIGLWYWDPGAKNRFWQDWLDWNKHIVHGGVAVIKDTGHGDLGAMGKMNIIDGSGAFTRESSRDGVTVLRRR